MTEVRITLSTEIDSGSITSIIDAVCAAIEDILDEDPDNIVVRVCELGPHDRYRCPISLDVFTDLEAKGFARNDWERLSDEIADEIKSRDTIEAATEMNDRPYVWLRHTPGHVSYI